MLSALSPDSTAVGFGLVDRSRHTAHFRDPEWVRLHFRKHSGLQSQSEWVLGRHLLFDG